MRSSLFDSSILATAQQAVEFVSNILESSTEYSLIGKDLDGKILLWNEGARRMYGYEAEEVVGKVNSNVLHTPEDVAAGKPREIMESAEQSSEGYLYGRARSDAPQIGKTLLGYRDVVLSLQPADALSRV
jgi:PAS domain S-box-containing protein